MKKELDFEAFVPRLQILTPPKLWKDKVHLYQNFHPWYKFSLHKLRMSYKSSLFFISNHTSLWLFYRPKNIKKESKIPYTHKERRGVVKKTCMWWQWNTAGVSQRGGGDQSLVSVVCVVRGTFGDVVSLVWEWDVQEVTAGWDRSTVKEWDVVLR